MPLPAGLAAYSLNHVFCPVLASGDQFNDFREYPKKSKPRDPFKYQEYKQVMVGLTHGVQHVWIGVTD